ncbi:hypothetical protein B9Z19DRAFT_1062661 [Tuber borchii]|uniref:Uncharacterized protein n=1 Tax=Tuber borchii TaxID=42251 RepID=A0A2T7A0Y7_TUBBO|nr:hypothetical protein B9Z19DRAFT_1062661 [Tuber borchii]
MPMCSKLHNTGGSVMARMLLSRRDYGGWWEPVSTHDHGHAEWGNGNCACGVCGSNLTKNSISVHLNRYPDCAAQWRMIWESTLLEAWESLEASIRNTIVIHFSAMDDPLRCPVCSYSFQTHNGALGHLRLKNGYDCFMTMEQRVLDLLANAGDE